MDRRVAALLVVLLALVPRLGAIAASNALGINPFGEGQAVGHARSAERIADMLLAGEADLRLANTYHRWGLVLAPFWWLPGPSELYAQVAMAVVGACAVGLVFLLGARLHSPSAGLLAAAPLALLPSYVMMHAVLQREAFILFALVAAMVLLFGPGDRLGTRHRYLLAGGLLLVPGYLRLQNLPVLVAIAAATLAVVAWFSPRLGPEDRVPAVAGLLVGGALVAYAVLSRFITTRPIAYLAALRERRVRGRATYLEWFVPTSLPEVVLFVPLGAVFFLFAPFPWHVETAGDAVLMLESAVGLAFAGFALWGARAVWRRSIPAATALVVGITIASVLYGLGTANYGIAVRHRQSIFWAIFLLGAIGTVATWHTSDRPAIRRGRRQVEGLRRRIGGA